MPITSVEKDIDSLTITITADFPVPVRRLWDAYVDPRQIERFWGPPEFPATFTQHDVRAGGESHYVMTGEDGSIHGGFWVFTGVDEGHSFDVIDGFAKPDGTRNDELPTMRMTFVFEETGDGSRLVNTTWFNSAEELEQLTAMGMEEGTRAAMGQIDDVLADLASFAADLPTSAQLLGDTQARVSRVIRGSADDVWRAHHDVELLKKWQLGPDGWTMPVCELADAVGGTYRFEWEQEDGEGRFGFTGELLEQDAPHREVTTERMIGMDAPPTRNELTLTPVEGGTLLVLVITYADSAMRETVLATGMADGMETSYARLESVI